MISTLPGPVREAGKGLGQARSGVEEGGCGAKAAAGAQEASTEAKARKGEGRRRRREFGFLSRIFSSRADPAELLPVHAGRHGFSLQNSFVSNLLR